MNKPYKNAEKNKLKVLFAPKLFKKIIKKKPLRLKLKRQICF